VVLALDKIIFDLNGTIWPMDYKNTPFLGKIFHEIGLFLSNHPKRLAQVELENLN
jgi:hypothetical protein